MLVQVRAVSKQQTGSHTLAHRFESLWSLDLIQKSGRRSNRCNPTHPRCIQLKLEVKMAMAVECSALAFRLEEYLACRIVFLRLALQQS